ncbi:TPA: hypothetical protein JTN89_005147 [Escherichia coli]|nr:putative GTP-binding protein [Escherichia coli]GDD84120.1 GTP-binding protein [Escherichia coli]HAX7016082.1 hypothetical protein [Escherichia coli]HAX7192104.1 hypothetical protein [Escherichia coli]HAX7347628.1 hypothetical protein [Escherichia coli]
MNPSDAIEAIEKPLSSLPYSLSRHILEHLRIFMKGDHSITSIEIG